MKKIFTFLAAAALIAGCSKTDEAPTSSYTITGYSTADTRTEFGEPGAETIPFLWTKGDKVWVGSQQSDALAAGGESATFTLSSAPQDGAAVYYNMTGSGATASVPTAQDAANSLGANGDFGYATLSGNSFALKHATSYLWFDVTTTDFDATLLSVTVDAGDAAIAGSATWSGQAFGQVNDPASTITLEVGANVAMPAMVVLPTEVSALTVTYEFLVDGVTKYYEQTLDAKTIEVGKTYKISATPSQSDLYELRTLTFEGDDWTALISEGEYGNGNGQYSWYDEDNTELMFYPNPNAAFPGYGGHAISNYTGSDLSQGNYEHDLQAYNVTGGANGSDNFCVHFGYIDDSGYGMQNEMVGIEFGDETARVIESMYVTNTTYVYNLLENGDGWQVPTGAGENSWYKIVAYGYDSVDAADEDYTKSVEFTLWENGEGVSEWTKWDLSGLGKVAKVRFNLVGSDDLYGDYGLGVAGYFAYDDVTVRF